MRPVTITSSAMADLVHVASSRGATYADARTVEREHEAVTVKDGAVESVTRTHLVTSEGTDVSQEIVETGAGLSVLAVKAGHKPAGRYDSRLVRQAGWEYVEHLDLVARAKRYREDAESTLDAPLADERPTTLVFAPEFLALLVHQACGHPTE